MIAKLQVGEFDVQIKYDDEDDPNDNVVVSVRRERSATSLERMGQKYEETLTMVEAVNIRFTEKQEPQIATNRTLCADDADDKE